MYELLWIEFIANADADGSCRLFLSGETLSARVVFFHWQRLFFPVFVLLCFLIHSINHGKCVRVQMN